MLYINTGNKSIYRTSVTGTLPSPQGDASNAVTMDLTTFPPVERTALSVVSAPAHSIYFPTALFKWQDAASVQVSQVIASDDYSAMLTAGATTYAVFGPAETRTDAQIIVDGLKAQSIKVAVRIDGKITGEYDRDVFSVEAFPSGDVIVVDSMPLEAEFLNKVIAFGSVRTVVIDPEGNGGGRLPVEKLRAVRVNDPATAGYASLSDHAVLYELVDRDIPGPVPGTQPQPPQGHPHSGGSNDHINGTTGSYGRVSPERYKQLMSGPKETVVRHGTVASLLATLNSIEHLRLHDRATIRSALIERAIADSDALATDVISVAITYPIKEDTYVDEELGDRHDRDIVLFDSLVTITVTKRMSRARRFMSWFIIPTAIVAGTVALVKDSISIGRGER